MGTVIDYVKWRGDLLFSQDPFNHIDALILSLLSYLPLKNVVPGRDSRKRISLEESAHLYFQQNPSHAEDPPQANLTVSPAMDAALMRLLKITSHSKRFAGMQLSSYEEITDFEAEQQFAAVTFHLSNSKREKVITFRGTDNTLIGWKEDFKMAYKEKIPAQESACNYLRNHIGILSGIATVCGHSKGGNLAVYAASCLNRLDLNRTSRIINFDGPGFDFSIVSRSKFDRCESKVENYIPEESIVGVLLQGVGNQNVIRSSAAYLHQHNPMTWEIEQKEFVKGRISKTTKLLKENLESWIDSLTLEERKALVDALFEILGASEEETIRIQDSLKDINKVIKNYANLDKDIKNMISAVLSSMTKQAKNVIADSIKEKFTLEK